ncbi:dihydrodipicolinate synthase family protein [Ruania zhangjianzhongii]|uniref:dihydrodipicolinate synthase family protein n=1 Tax=Ruania zhangjianzhongii TaxID=2603206 RepID=UPI0011CCBFE7|nr:dihydrodipicolinate synthase family protein [Ruania zhangjianzhongii]
MSSPVSRGTVQGLVPIVATPFRPNGELDLPSLRRLIEFQLASGVDGVAIFGMASEAFALTQADRQQVLATVTDVVAGQCPIVAGINGTSTITAIEQIHDIGGAAHTLMVLPPFMVKPTAGQLVDFYGDVAGVAVASDTQVMVQDAPGATGVSMAPALVAELADLDGVTSVKVEAPPTVPKVAAVRAALADRGTAILGGQNAQFVLEEYSRGAVGTMPACEFVDVLGPILTAWQAGRADEARREFAALLPLIVFGLQQGIAWAVHKEVLLARGIIDHSTVRSPAQDLDAPGRASLTAIMSALALPTYG